MGDGTTCHECRRSQRDCECPACRPFAPGEWEEGRARIEANPEAATVTDKSRFNVWDNVAVVFETIQNSLSGKWLWWRCPACKYIDVRIDMRSGNCIIRNNQGQRINPADLRYQAGTAKVDG